MEIKVEEALKEAEENNVEEEVWEEPAVVEAPIVDVEPVAEVVAEPVAEVVEVIEVVEIIAEPVVG